jgi:ribosome-associated protein
VHFFITKSIAHPPVIEITPRKCYLARVAIFGGSALSYVDTPALAARPEATTPLTSEALLKLVLSSLDDDKAEDVVRIDLRGKSAMADTMVIASGRSTRQVAAMAQKLMDRLKETFRLSARVEGKETGDWVLIDTGDVVVHIFRPEVREFYQLEKMWQDIGRPAV